MNRFLLLCLCLFEASFTMAQNYYGNEFKINENEIDLTYAEDFCAPDIAALHDGNYAVCWTGYREWNYDIYLQIISSDGEFIGGHVVVNEFTGNTQEDPDMAVLKDGKIVICWESWRQDGDGKSISARLFNQDGTPFNAEWIVNRTTNFDQFEPAVASLEDGGFVISWVHKLNYDYNEIRSQRYNESGEKKGATEFLANQYTDFSRFVRFPDIVGLSDGKFVVCYQHEKHHQDIFCQLFHSNGDYYGDELIVNSTSFQHQRYPVMSALDDGGFVICWEDNVNDMDKEGVYGQKFDGLGYTHGSEFLVNAYTVGSQKDPDIASISNGEFMICWQSWRQDWYKYGIFGQFFDSDSKKKYEEFLISRPTLKIQTSPSVCVSKNGDIFIAWIYSTSPVDGRPSIYGKILPRAARVYELENFSLASPSNDATLEDTRIKFIWHQPGRIQENYPWEIRFNLYIADDINFLTPQIIKDIPDTSYIFSDVEQGHSYFWKILAFSGSDSIWSDERDWGFFVSHSAIAVDEEEEVRSPGFKLYQNYPNPFNPNTTIHYSIDERGTVSITIYSVTGKIIRELVNKTLDAGDYEVVWDATDNMDNKVSSGLYFYRLKMINKIQYKKMIVAR
ncbi:T9SS type A sorting domain-containing protein [candidate division KSB1 bacterium]|nr:T9SS type A sorting domain-containing protein [candidate division KSB1 bacterium]